MDDSYEPFAPSVGSYPELPPYGWDPKVVQPHPDLLRYKELGYLCSHGIFPTIQAIRSSDLEGFHPWMYFLTRMCGIKSTAKEKEWATLGTWFHRVHQLAVALGDSYEPEDLRKAFENLFQLQSPALAEAIQEDGSDPVSGLQHHYKIAQMGLALYLASIELKVPGIGTRWDLYIKRLYRSLGTEILCGVSDLWLEVGGANHDRLILIPGKIKKENAPFPDVLLRVHPEQVQAIAAQFDQLLYDEQSNCLFVLDLKTTSRSAVERAASCPFEAQTWHYLTVLAYFLQKYEISGIPPDVRIGGMIHVIVQKPGIRMGLNDRDFKIQEKEITRGPNKGQVKLEKVYEGEPRFENYLDRCRQWLEERHEEEPVVVIHRTDMDPPVDPKAFEPPQWYLKRLLEVHHAGQVPIDGLVRGNIYIGVGHEQVIQDPSSRNPCASTANIRDYCCPTCYGRPPVSVAGSSPYEELARVSLRDIPAIARSPGWTIQPRDYPGDFEEPSHFGDDQESPEDSP